MLIANSLHKSQDVLQMSLRNEPQRPTTAARGLKLLAILWASPYSSLGLMIGVAGLAFGGRGRFQDGALEFYGGLVQRLVRKLPTGERTAGFTLGHVILGQTADGLDAVGLHERVHVRQFERWGPLMGPAYLSASVWMWLLGKRAYRDNPFEVQAYREAP